MIDKETIITILLAIFASNGLWTFIISRFNFHDKTRIEDEKRSKVQSKMLKGLAHDRIVALGSEYIQRGSITHDEYENLHDYLFIPYQELGGNGTAKKVMDEVDKLQLK